MPALLLRLGVMVLLVGLLAAKFLLPAPMRQIEPAVLNAHLTEALNRASAENITETRRDDRDDQHRFQFTLKDCPVPYVALQAGVLEDLAAALDHAVNLPDGLAPHIFYLGKELEFADRVGLKLTAVEEFVAFRLGRSPEMPSGDLFILLAKPGCTGYRTIEWWRVWTA